MKFLKWLIGTLVIDPLIMLFVWNVIVVPMFTTGRTEYSVCMIISIIINIIYAGYQLNKED